MDCGQQRAQMPYQEDTKQYRSRRKAGCFQRGGRVICKYTLISLLPPARPYVLADGLPVSRKPGSIAGQQGRTCCPQPLCALLLPAPPATQAGACRWWECSGDALGSTFGFCDNIPNKLRCFSALGNIWAHQPAWMS